MQNSEILSSSLSINEGYLYEYYQDRDLCISVDWFKIFGQTKKIPIPDNSQDFYQITDDLILRYKNQGTEQFKYLFEVIFFDTVFGLIEFEPRMSQMTKGNFMFKMDNEYLYSKDWNFLFLELLENLNAKLVSISRLDIAIDGANHIQKFLNKYLVESLEGNDNILRSGKSLKSKNESCKILSGIAQYNENNTDKYGCQSFIIGSPKSEKMIVFYNKTSELKMSNKEYIAKFWEKNGLDTTQENYRIEMRLKSKLLAEMKLTQESNEADQQTHLINIIKKLNQPEFLASLFEINCQNFFEFYRKTQKNVSRCPKYKLINFQKFGSQVLLERQTKVKQSDNYKAKLSIHLIYKQLLTEKLEKIEAQTARKRASSLINDYSLENWFQKKVLDWVLEYQVKTANTKIINYLIGQINKLKLNSLSQYIEHQDFILDIEHHKCTELGFRGNNEKLYNLYQKLIPKIDFLLKNRILDN